MVTAFKQLSIDYYIGGPVVSGKTILGGQLKK